MLAVNFQDIPGNAINPTVNGALNVTGAVVGNSVVAVVVAPGAATGSQARSVANANTASAYLEIDIGVNQPGISAADVNHNDEVALITSSGCIHGRRASGCERSAACAGCSTTQLPHWVDCRSQQPAAVIRAPERGIVPRIPRYCLPLQLCVLAICPPTHRSFCRHGSMRTIGVHNPCVMRWIQIVRTAP